MEALLTEGEAAHLVRMIPTRFRKLVHRREIPCLVLPDDEVRFDREELRAWLEQFRRPAAMEREAPLDE